MKVLHHRARIDAVGTTAVVIHDPPERARRGLLRDLIVPYPVLVDLELRAYADWGLGRASWASTYASPRVWAGYLRRILLEGEHPGLGSELQQLGGDFIIGPDGRLTYSHPQRSVDDRPPVGRLIHELEVAARR